MPFPTINTGGQIPVGLPMEWRLDIMTLAEMQGVGQAHVIRECIRAQLPGLVEQLSPDEKKDFNSLREALEQKWGLQEAIAADQN